MPTHLVLLTGAAGDGIGRAVSRCLAREGATIILTDKHDKRVALATEALNAEFPGDHVGYVMDVTDRARIRSVMGEVEARFGRLDAVVNNAFSVSQSNENDPEAWDSCIEVNLTGPWNVSVAARDLLLRSTNGAIVNLTTAAADLGHGTQVNMGYVAGKGGLNTLTRALANAWGPLGIRCNAVSMYAVTGTRVTDDFAENYVEPLRRVPLGRFPTVDDIANAVKFLCSESSRNITGEILNVSAGYYMRF